MPGAKPVLVSHRHRENLARIGVNGTRRHAPLLKMPMQLCIFFIKRPHLAVAATTETSKIYDPAAIDEMPVADIGRKLRIELRIF